jgi:DNA-binding NtrC family response regulator
MDEKLEKLIDEKVRPIVEEAMQKYLGVTVSEIEQDISDKIKKSPLIEFDIDTSIPFKQAKKSFKKKYINRLLQLNLGNVAEVARVSGLDRRSVHRLITELSIDPDKFRHILMRGAYVKRAEVKNIIESSVEHYKSALNPDKYSAFYEHVPKISEDIAKELPAAPLPIKEAERQWEKKFLAKALEENNHNISQTAKKIGIRFETLHRKLKSLGLI